MKPTKIFNKIIFLFLVSFSCLASAETTQSLYGWHYLIAPYLWASGIDGDVTVRNFSKTTHVSFFDILRHLDFAAQGHVEAGYGPLTFMIDPTYMKLSENKKGDRINARATIQNVLVDGGVFYRIFLRPVTCNRFVSFEVLGGARYLGINNRIDFDELPTLSQTINMTAPIVGGRLKYDVTAQTHLWLRGDVGGFHVDHVTNTWSATAGLSCTVNPHLDLGISYRVLKINYARNDTAMNTYMYGPMIGIGFHS